MAKFQLTISKDYVPNWGLYEGVREIIQNAIDAQTDGYPMTINYCPRKQLLEVVSSGARLDRKVWLMGCTSKMDDSQYLGHFGEGLKLAALVLTRLGRQMSIINGDETWRPSLEASEVFADTVLAISTRKCNETGNFTVSLPLASDEWGSYKNRFLALTPPTEVLPSTEADILLDPECRRNLFVKGIYVENRPDFHAGYNFHSARTDRDRQIVKSWDAEYAIRCAWRAAHREGRVTGTDMLTFLLSDAGDARLFNYGANDDLVQSVSEAFRVKYGEHAIPVSDEAGQLRVGHFGKRGIVCPSHVVKFFADCPDMDFHLLMAANNHRVVKTHTINSLTPAEQAVFYQVISLSEIAAKTEDLTPVTPRTEVVDFASSDLLGLRHGDGQIQISRRLLGSFQAAMAAVVHELAHDCGSDGSVHHERAEGRLFSAVIDHLLKSGSVVQLSDEVLAALSA